MNMSLHLEKSSYQNKFNFEFCVVRWNWNKQKPEMFNIFNNHYVYEGAVELTKDYVEGKIATRKEYVEKLGKTIQWQEWSRAEYEISVGDVFPHSLSELHKVDCWMQAIANIDLIADMCVQRYKENLTF